MLIYGVNPVLEALRAGRVEKLRISRRALRESERGGTRLEKILKLAASRNVLIEPVDPLVLDRDSGAGVHQGVAATVEAPQGYTVEDLVRSARGAPLIVVLDGVEDPHNVGAILRTADAAGADGVVMQTRRSAALGGAAAKASAGAVAHVKVARVVNISRAVDELKQLGVWTAGLAVERGQRYDTVDFSVATAFVVGSEGDGLRRLVREHCDRLISIPMLGLVESLNVSVATGVILFEAVRQRASKQ